MKTIDRFSDDVKVHAWPPGQIRIVFYVDNPSTKEVLVEKSQIFLELGTDPLKSLTIAELARDHMAESVAVLKACEDEKRGLTAAEIEINKDRALRRKYVEEILLCAADLMQRFIRSKLRDWAQKKAAEGT